MAIEPIPDRPHMPGYGVEPASSGGLLDWSWAEQRLARSHDYWLASIHPAGRPHLMPVWGVYLDGSLWCSTGPESRKALNLAANPAVSVATVDAGQPVIVEGVAAAVTDRDAVERFSAAMDAKYGTTYGAEFYSANLTLRVDLRQVFGLDTEAFTTSPTRWRC
jgi:hypothetical protein